MSKATLWRTVLALGLAAGTTLAFATGCSKQGEGERCSPSSNGNADCDDGLYCKPTGEADFGRCCPVDLATVGDARCSFTPNMATTGGTNGAGTGGGGSAGTNTGGSGASTSGASTGGTGTGGASTGGRSSTGGANASGGDAPGTGGGEEPGGGAAGSSPSGGDSSAAGAGAMSSE